MIDIPDLSHLQNSPLASKAWRLCNLYTIIDAEGKLIPFSPNIAQRTYYNNKHYNDIILKSRKMGFSTLIEIDHLDDLLFSPNFTAGIIDYTLDDAKFKLAMMRTAWDHLDNQDLHPTTYKIGSILKRAIDLTGDAATELRFANGSIARASTSLRGSTPQRLHISELGKTSIFAPKKAQEILNGAFNSLIAGNSIKSESTHEGGRIGIHYNLLRKAMEKNPEQLTAVDMRFHFFPWYLDPRYQLHEPYPIRDETRTYFQKLANETNHPFTHPQMLWYERKRDEQGHGMKKEFPSTAGEAFEAISDHAIYGTEIANLRASHRITTTDKEAGYPIYLTADIGLSDFFSIWLIQPVGRHHLILDWREYQGAAAGKIADAIRELANQWGQIDTIFLPHDAQTRDRGSGKTYVQTLRDYGVTNTRVVPRTPDIWLGIGYVREILPHCYFNTKCEIPRTHNGEEFPSGLHCLEGYSRDVSANVLREMPKHDAFSHSADAFRTYAEAFKRGLVHSQFSNQPSHQTIQSIGIPKRR